MIAARPGVAIGCRRSVFVAPVATDGTPTTKGKGIHSTSSTSGGDATADTQRRPAASELTRWEEHEWSRISQQLLANLDCRDAERLVAAAEDLDQRVAFQRTALRIEVAADTSRLLRTRFSELAAPPEAGELDSS